MVEILAWNWLEWTYCHWKLLVKRFHVFPNVESTLDFLQKLLNTTSAKPNYSSYLHNRTLSKLNQTKPSAEKHSLCRSEHHNFPSNCSWLHAQNQLTPGLVSFRGSAPPYTLSSWCLRSLKNAFKHNDILSHRRTTHNELALKCIPPRSF